MGRQRCYPMMSEQIVKANKKSNQIEFPCVALLAIIKRDEVFSRINKLFLSARSLSQFVAFPLLGCKNQFELIFIARSLRLDGGVIA